MRWPHGMTPAVLGTPQYCLGKTHGGLTIVVHCLFESLETLAKHLCIDVDNFNGGLSVGILFACVIEDTKCNVARSSGDIDATKGTLATRPQGGDKSVLPQPVYAQRCSVVHQVVLGRHAIEDAFHEGFFGFLWDCLESERGGPTRRLRTARGCLTMVFP